MKVCCGVTLFYPSHAEVERIRFYSSIFETVYVFDNTDTTESSAVKDLKSLENVHFLNKLKENTGLSHALNSMCQMAVSSYDFICLLDQDSVFDEFNIKRILSFIDANKCEQLAVVAPNIIYDNNQHVSSVNVETIDWTITSGSFINLPIFKKIGGFDENYFIDRLDYDYCYHAKLHGYTLVKINDSLLFQSLGSPRSLFGYCFYEHSPLRNYYIIRNRIYFYLFKSKKCALYGIYKIFSGSCLQLLKIIIVEKDKIDKFKFFYKAIVDAFNGKYGKFNG